MSFGRGGFRARRQRASLDITPLIDCVFQLLVFFLLTWSFITTPNFGVELPKAAVKPQLAEQRDLLVVVTRAGEIELNARKLAPAGLREALRRAHAEQPDARVLIRADTRAYHGTVVMVMDAARSVGFRRLGVAVESSR